MCLLGGEVMSQFGTGVALIINRRKLLQTAALGLSLLLPVASVRADDWPQ